MALKKKLFLVLFLANIILLFSQSENKKIDSLNSIIKRSSSDKQLTEAFIEKAKQFEDINADSTDYYIEKALNITQRIELPYQKAESLLIKAQRFIVKGEYGKSTLVYKEVNEFLKDFKFPDLRITYFGDLGILHFYQGDFSSALDNFEKALALSREEKDEQAQLRFLNNSALAMSYLNEAEASIKVHEEAMGLAKKLNDSASLGRSLNNLGLIYEDMGEYKRALKFYENSLEIKMTEGTDVDILNSKYNVAGMHKEIAEKNNDTLLLKKTKLEFEQIFKEAKRAKYGKVQLFAKSGMAQIETSIGNYSEAIKVYKQLIKKADSLNDKQTLRISLLNLGVNQIRLNEFSEGLVSLKKAKVGIEESGNPADKAKLFENLAIVYEETGQFKSALNYKKMQIDIEKFLSSEELQSRISEFEVKYETEKKENEILQQRAQLAENNLEIRKKSNQIYLSIGFALILGLIGYLFYQKQKIHNTQLKKEAELKTILARVETQNRLQEQRLRISRDLHDNIGSQLTFIISSLDNLKYGLNKTDKKLVAKIGEIGGFTKTTINELRDTIWAMNKEYITYEDLKSRILNLVDTASKSSKDINFKVDLDAGISDDYQFSAIEGINIFRIIQEAINNAVKYAFDDSVSPNEIHLVIMVDLDELIFSVTDNGKGFDDSSVQRGNGVQNIERRVKDIEGVLKLNTLVGKGVEVRFSIPKKYT